MCIFDLNWNLLGNIHVAGIVREDNIMLKFIAGLMLAFTMGGLTGHAYEMTWGFKGLLFGIPIFFVIGYGVHAFVNDLFEFFE